MKIIVKLPNDLSLIPVEDLETIEKYSKDLKLKRYLFSILSFKNIVKIKVFKTPITKQ